MGHLKKEDATYAKAKSEQISRSESADVSSECAAFFQDKFHCRYPSQTIENITSILCKRRYDSVSEVSPRSKAHIARPTELG
jgi:hypothetical protein